MKGIPISLDIQDKIVDLYEKGYRAKEIAQIFNLTDSGCMGILRKRGVQTRNMRDYYPPQFNVRYFQDIDSEAKAYWLGFIFADGCVSKESIIIGLSSKDDSHVVKFAKYINSTNVIQRVDRFDKRTNKLYSNSRIQLGSQLLIKDIERYNLVPQKSLLASPNIDSIPDNLVRHFWRGVFDGDGSIYRVKSRKDKEQHINSWHVYLCGSYAMNLMFYNFIGKLDAYFYPKCNIWYLSYSNLRSCQIILDLLYKDSTIYLDRKYQQYLTFKEFNP